MRRDRSFHAFNGWDEPPQLYDDAQADELEFGRSASAENSPGQVLWEIGLVLAVPLALTVIVETILQAFQIV
jgi:hypothetical protein